MKLLVKGGRVIDPANNLDEIADVLVEDGLIRQVEPGINEPGAEMLAVEGKVVCPGFIDIRPSASRVMNTRYCLRHPGSRGRWFYQFVLYAQYQSGD